MQDDMLSTVRRIDERKDRSEAHVVVGEGNCPGVGRECAIDSAAYWRGEIPAYRISKMLRFDLERVQRIFLAKGVPTIVRPRGARSAAPAADALSTIAPVR
jgi:hypothetical protein